MQVRALPLLTLAAVCASAWQAPPSAPELAHKVRETRLEATVRAHGRLVVTDAAKNQTVYQIAVLQKRLARSTNLVWSVTDPPAWRRRILIEIAPSGRAAIRQSLGDAPAAEVPTRRWSDSILNSLVTYEDLLDDYLEWPAQTSAGQEQLGGRTCDLIRSEPDQ